jgi:hypothetical protein
VADMVMMRMLFELYKQIEENKEDTKEENNDPLELFLEDEVNEEEIILNPY